MPSGNLRPLYIGQCLEDLKKEYDIEPEQDAKKLCRSAPKLFSAAEQCRISGDEETSYIYYMRYLSLIHRVKYLIKKDESAKQYFKELNRSNIREAVEHAEKLATSLERRYKLLKEKENIIQSKLQEEEKKDQKIEVTAKRGEVGDSVNGFADVSDDFMSCKRLNDLLHNKKMVLIMDVRPVASFLDSYMKYDCVINVPQEIVKPGISASTLEKSLPPGSLALWKQRGKFSLIVLVDWSTSVKTSKLESPIYVLKDTLLKWDTDFLYKNNVIILDGGFEEWLCRYPTYTTNPHPQSLPSLQSLITMDSLDAIEYPNLSESPEFPQPSVDRSSKPTHSFSSVSSSSSSLKLLTLKQSPSLIIPTHQKPSVSSSKGSSSSSRPNVDRQSKAAAVSTYEERSRKVQKLLMQEEAVVVASLGLEKDRLAMEEEREQIRSQREKEAEEEMRLHLQQHEEELLRNIKELERKQKEKDKENQALREELNEYKRREKEENIPREYSTYKQQEEVIKARIRNVEEQRLKIAEERKNREEHQNEQKKKPMEPSDTSQNKPKILPYSERERLAREKLQLDRLQKDKFRQENEQIKNEKLRNELRSNKDIRLSAHTTADRDHKRIVDIHDEITNTNRSIVKNRLEPDRGTYMTSLKDTPSVTIKRSHSSPNITQLDDEDLSDKGKFSTSKSPHLLEGRYSRHRNFSPVFGNMGRGLTGLKNLGNTCYMNSIIQCLSNTTLLANYFVSGSYCNDINRQTETHGEIAEEVAAVVRALWSSTYKCIATRDLRNVIGKYREQFQTSQQQDSNEFLTILMDWLHEDLKKPAVKRKDTGGELQDWEKHWKEFYKENTSLIVALFYGQQKSTVRCLQCNKESVRYETFSNLTLPLPSNTNSCSLEDCVELYVKGEHITGWKCPVCKEHRDAMKKFDIIKLPPVLIIHFKRFYIDGWCRKRQTSVKFPLRNWDMKKYTLYPDQKYTNYDLYGVSNHYGTMEGGHYTAYCKSTEHKKWYKFDDNEVSEISSSDVESGAAYILFYASIHIEVPDVS